MFLLIHYFISLFSVLSFQFGFIINEFIISVCQFVVFLYHILQFFVKFFFFLLHFLLIFLCRQSSLLLFFGFFIFINVKTVLFEYDRHNST